jgi:hypothetical protein
MIPNPTFPSRHTECLAGAYAQHGETALRPGCAGQRFRRIGTLREVLFFFRKEASRSRRLSLMTSN